MPTLIRETAQSEGRGFETGEAEEVRSRSVSVPMTRRNDFWENDDGYADLNKPTRSPGNHWTPNEENKFGRTILRPIVNSKGRKFALSFSFRSSIFLVQKKFLELLP